MKYSRLLDAVCFCVLTALTSTSYAAPVTGQGTWETTLEARDLDGDVSTIEAYFDNALNITWLADANHALTTGYDADGLMHWDAANTWAANLDPYGSGIAGWRLPTVSPVNGSTFTYAFAYDGTTEFGYNISAPGTIYAESTTSEMAHLFYNTLGNVAYYDTSGNGPQTGWGLTNTGPFSNIQTADFYWSSTESPANTNNAWFFNFDIGGQTANDKAYFNFFSWAVHDGDVGNPIPQVPFVICVGADIGMFYSAHG